MIGRADIEGSKSHVAMNAWRPQASSSLPKRFLKAFLRVEREKMHCRRVFHAYSYALSSGSRLYLECKASRHDYARKIRAFSSTIGFTSVPLQSLKRAVIYTICTAETRHFELLCFEITLSPADKPCSSDYNPLSRAFLLSFEKIRARFSSTLRCNLRTRGTDGIWHRLFQHLGTLPAKS